MNKDAIEHLHTLTRYKIASAVDGDGIIVRDFFGKVEKEIRLLGIDAPEIRRCKKLLQDEKETHLPAQLLIELGRRSLNYLLSQIEIGAKVSIKIETGNSTDIYGRLLAYVFLPDGRCLNEVMISEGYAKPYDRVFCSFLPYYQQLNLIARTQQKGLYSITNTF
jgi:micrococcal nuclease